MIIKSINITNFLSYYDENRFDFDMGPTLIIGQNNTGKSKLFDAFNWVLFNRAFKTHEEKWDETSEWRSLIVNNQAKSECNIGNKVKCTVCIKFLDDKETKYQLSREYVIKRVTQIEWECPKNTNLYLSRTDPVKKNTEEFSNHDAEEIVKSLFPENLSRYFLFQGENISQIMSLGRKSDFIKALRDLSRIEVFELTKSYTQKVLNRINKEYEDVEDSNVQLQQEKKRQLDNIAELESRIKSIEDAKANLIKEKDLAKEIFAKRKEELSKFKECADILRDIKHNEELKKSKLIAKSDFITNKREDIINRWMYAGAEKKFATYLEIYESNKVNRKIPEPIRQEFIKEMLRKYKCLICGTDAPEDSNEYINIKKLLNDKALDKEIELINQISFVVDTQSKLVASTKTELQDYYHQIDVFDEEIKTYALNIKQLNEDLLNVKPADLTADEIKTKNFSLLQESYDSAKTELEDKQSDLDHKLGIESSLKEDHKKYKDVFNKLVDSSDYSVEKERLKIVTKLNDSAHKFYDTFYNKLISDIEYEANMCFEKMTNSNPALSGKVKVDSVNNEVYTVDEKGKRLQNINQANKVSLQIAFVAAILSVSNNFWDIYFPFIADAPISALGGSNKITAIKTIMEIFDQSILILKDDAEVTDINYIKEDPVRKLINNEMKIKHAYELKMEGTPLEKQHTKIIKL